MGCSTDVAFCSAQKQTMPFWALSVCIVVPLEDEGTVWKLTCSYGLLVEGKPQRLVCKAERLAQDRRTLRMCALKKMNAWPRGMCIKSKKYKESYFIQKHMFTHTLRT